MTTEKIGKLKTQKKPAVVRTPEQIEAESELPSGRQMMVTPVGGNNDYDVKPSLVTMDIETIMPEFSRTNAEIVFGRDRPASRFGKYTSDSGAAAIDIVVGRMAGPTGVEVGPPEPSVDPNFDFDSARIHISQKTDVDANFGIKEAGQGISRSKSAIALKADGIRLVARESMKLVTGTDKKNSQGGDIKSIQGISLVAGNIDTEVQPMVKGENLTGALKELKDLVVDLNAIVKQFCQAQKRYNGELQNHFHYSSVFGNANTPSDQAVVGGVTVQMELLQQTMRSLYAHRTNLNNWETNHLNNVGQKFILSKWNKTN
jgi:hypothetical protein